MNDTNPLDPDEVPPGIETDPPEDDIDTEAEGGGTGYSNEFEWMKIESLTEEQEKALLLQGFYCAFGIEERSDTSIANALTEARREHDQALETIRHQWDNVERLVQYKISHHDSEWKRQEDKRDDLKDKPDQLAEEASELESRQEDQTKDVTAKLDELETEKKRALESKISDRIKNIKNDIDLLIDTYLLEARKRDEINRSAHRDRADFHSKTYEFVEKQRDQIEQEWDVHTAKVNALAKSGVTRLGSFFVYQAGWAGVLAAGWFYSAHAVATGFRSETYLHYVFKQFIEFSRYWFSGSPSAALFGGWVGALLMLLALVTAVAGVAQWLLTRYHHPNWIGVVHPVGKLSRRQRKLLNRIARRPVGPYTRWLQALPQVLVLGLAITLLALISAVGNPNIDAVLQSLATEFVGTLIALGIAGLAYVYVAYVVEPRQERAGAAVRLRHHVEIAAVGFLFLVVCGLMMWSNVLAPPVPPDAASPPPLSAPMIRLAALSFGALSLLAGFTLAYGARFRGIYRAEREAALRLEAYTARMEQEVAPRPLDVSLLESNAFRGRYAARLSELLEAMQDQTFALRREIRATAGAAQKSRGVVAWFLSRVRPSRGTQEDSAPPTTDLDDQLAPAQAFAFREACERLRQTKQRLQKVRDELQASELQATEAEREINRKTRRHRQAIHAHTLTLNEGHHHVLRCRQLLMQRRRATIALLKEGFDVGRTYQNRFDPRESTPPGAPPAGPMAPVTVAVPDTHTTDG